MHRTESDDRLSRITTLWSVVREAHGPTVDAAAEARGELLGRYAGAAYRYLLGAVRDPDAADELFQELALRVARGDFRRADPDRGRFRDFLKTALFHLIVDHKGRLGRRPVGLPVVADPEAPGDSPATEAADREFEHGWRDELLARAWEGLAGDRNRSGPSPYEVLRFRADHPEMPSHRMAEELGARLGQPLTAPAVRQALHRARERFADHLLDEVALSLDTDAPDRLEDELIELHLLDYCRTALAKRRGDG